MPMILPVGEEYVTGHLAQISKGPSHIHISGVLVVLEPFNLITWLVARLIVLLYFPIDSVAFECGNILIVYRFLRTNTTQSPASLTPEASDFVILY